MFQYKTLVIEEENIEVLLNNEGIRGWELVSITPYKIENSVNRGYEITLYYLISRRKID